MPSGGKRPGSGRPKGTGHPIQQTLEKRLLRERAMELIEPHLGPLLEAQIANAKGLSYLVTRDRKTGKFLRVGPAKAANPDEETLEVWEKDPSVLAFTDLMNRLLDKPKEQAQDVNLNVTDVADILKQRHARHTKTAE